VALTVVGGRCFSMLLTLFVVGLPVNMIIRLLPSGLAAKIDRKTSKFAVSIAGHDRLRHTMAALNYALEEPADVQDQRVFSARSRINRFQAAPTATATVGVMAPANTNSHQPVLEIMQVITGKLDRAIARCDGWDEYCWHPVCGAAHSKFKTQRLRKTHRTTCAKYR